MLTGFKQKIKSLTLVPAGGGCFEVSADGAALYSKLATGTFPDEQAVYDMVAQRLKT